MRTIKGFTLIELLVVMAIIAITVAVVSVPGLFSSGDKTKAVKSIESAVMQARSYAKMHKTTAAVRFEQKYATDERGIRIKGFSIPVGVQQINIVAYGIRQSDNFGGYTGSNYVREDAVFRRIKGDTGLELSKKWWVAPDFALLGNIDKEYTSTNQQADPINTLNTFFIAFDRFGELRTTSPVMNYIDESQPYDNVRYPIVEYPLGLNVARACFVYDREKYLASGNLVSDFWISVERK